MNFYSSILKLFYTSVFNLLMICVLYSLGKQTLLPDRRVFVVRNETVILNCTCLNQNVSSWRVLKYPRVTARETDATDESYIPYTQGLLLNPKLMNSNIDIVGDNKSGECNLIIRNFSNYDEGTYKCDFWKNGNIYTDIYHLQIRIPPIVVNSNNEVQDGRFGQKINLTVILYNKFGRIQAYISKLNESLNIPARQQRTLIREQFHNVNVTVSGIQVIFQIILDTYDDFTNYTITACNKEGCNEFIVHIMLTDLVEYNRTHKYGDCWAIAGSIVGGIILFCIALNIYCSVKRSRKFNWTLNFSAQVNDREIYI